MARTVTALCLLAGLLLFAPSMGGDSSSALSRVGVQQLHAQVPPCIIIVFCSVTPTGSECWEFTFCG